MAVGQTEHRSFTAYTLGRTGSLTPWSLAASITYDERITNNEWMTRSGISNWGAHGVLPHSKTLGPFGQSPSEFDGTLIAANAKVSVCDLDNARNYCIFAINFARSFWHGTCPKNQSVQRESKTDNCLAPLCLVVDIRSITNCTNIKPGHMGSSDPPGLCMIEMIKLHVGLSWEALIQPPPPLPRPPHPPAQYSCTPHRPIISTENTSSYISLNHLGRSRIKTSSPFPFPSHPKLVFTIISHSCWAAFFRNEWQYFRKGTWMCNYQPQPGSIPIFQYPKLI